MKKIFFVVLLCIFSALMLAGCGTNKFGTGIDPAAAKVSIKDVYLTPALEGKTVTIEGKIATQCTSNGCWFILVDTTGQIFVNLAPNNFTLPPNQGKQVKVTGKVASSPNGMQIIASGVEVG